jgi:hypothetical protein
MPFDAQFNLVQTLLIDLLLTSTFYHTKKKELMVEELLYLTSVIQ